MYFLFCSRPFLDLTPGSPTRSYSIPTSRTFVFPACCETRQACGALALSLAMAGSLPAVRCRSDEAAWSNLHSILAHKATRLSEPRATWRASSSGSAMSAVGPGGASAAGGAGVGVLGASKPGSALGNWEGASGRGSGGSTGASSAAASSKGGAGGSGVSPSGGVGGPAGGPGGSGSAGSGHTRKGSRDVDLPPWVAAVLWASLHALPKV